MFSPSAALHMLLLCILSRSRASCEVSLLHCPVVGLHNLLILTAIKAELFLSNTEDESALRSLCDQDSRKVEDTD